MSKDRLVACWSCYEHAEVINCDDKDAAIGEFLDSQEQWEGTITVYGFARMVAPKPDMGDAVDLVENFFAMNWEELQGEDGWDAPNSTCEAALEFLTVLHDDFVPWSCEVVTSEEIDVGPWIKEHKPNWLADRKAYIASLPEDQ